ncbi:Respiratory nitrate reductase 1 alpha chain [Raoultella terrigena]|uniref:Respiratory nitrate reductase 1 alpha chain n=1 Tax=Raoultella terrigena TaxID=577 RepID=A0A4U9CV01_RAOTE|nr:Respiratory nitrate reductase 1 alpha chain [Raoultella terrigena]
MLKYLLGTEHGIQGMDLGKQGGVKPEEVEWQDNGLDGKLDLVVTLDFRLSSTCLYSDIVLPTATLVRKRRHEYFGYASVYSTPLSAAVDPAWESEKATGKSTRASRRHSPKSAWATSEKKPTW